MLRNLTPNRTRLGIAAVVTCLTAGGAAAWATSSSPADPSVLASSSEAPGDISGPCDEAENATKPECAGTSPVDTGTSVTTVPQTPTTSPATTTSPTTAPPATAAPAPIPAPAPPPPAAPAPPAPAPPPPASGVRSFAAAGAGTVRYQVNGNSFTLIEAVPAAGWQVEVERASGHELDLDFRSGGRRVQVDVEFEDGGIRERVRVRDDDDGGSGSGGGGGHDDRDDDHRGRGRGSDDTHPDDSGRGRGGDRHDDD